MRKNFFNKTFVYLPSSLTLLFSYPAFAHPGSKLELGMSHVIMSSEHVLTFLICGLVVGFIVQKNRARSIFIGNSLLLIFLGFQLISHGINNGALFGIEVLLPGSLIALISWQVTQLLCAYAAIHKHKRRTKINIAPPQKPLVNPAFFSTKTPMKPFSESKK